MNDWAFIILAAGESRRYAKGRKQYRRLGSFPLWMWSARLAAGLMEAGKVREAVVVVPDGAEAEHRIPTGEMKGIWWVVRGGCTRCESVMKGLEATERKNALVHDAARPFATPGLCDRLMKKVRRGKGAIPLIAVNDALKQIDADERPIHVERENLYAVQTPQAFPRMELLEVLQTRKEPCVDDSQAWLESGREIETVKGNPENFKITYPEDFELAERIAGSRRRFRTGIGYDIHALTPERPMMLGGIQIDSPLGASGHSDGDALCHAICDALLGAAGEPDIGVLFPSSDLSLKGVKSTGLLAEVITRLQERNWSIEWIDAVIVLQAPRIGNEIPRIKESLNNIFSRLGFPRIVNLRAKSGENTGSVGNSEAVECYAVATLSGIEDLSG
ncbi:MAG: 2-C-methyl-D-erythritol 2,4-cyclodiphosphate synthase [Thermovirgaceae bacterium]